MRSWWTRWTWTRSPPASSSSPRTPMPAPSTGRSAESAPSTFPGNGPPGRHSRSTRTPYGEPGIGRRETGDGRSDQKTADVCRLRIVYRLPSHVLRLWCSVRTAVVHDWLNGMRGGEKVLEALLPLVPDPTIFTLFHVPGSVSREIEK